MNRVLLFILLMVLTVSRGFSKDISLTVYNKNLAIVKIVDELNFDKGLQTLSFTDVSKRIDPTSVRFTAENGAVTILEQNFRYDLVNSQKVLERYIDRNITIWVEGGELIEGVLQSVAGDVVLKGKDGGIKIVKLSAIKQFDFPELPEGLITRPTLFWKLYSKAAQTTETEVSFCHHEIFQMFFHEKAAAPEQCFPRMPVLWIDVRDIHRVTGFSLKMIV